MKKILVAGIGNIFQGDDAFGCEVLRQLNPDTFSDEVALMDFGIRSYDLAYALTDPYETVILVDAVGRGQPAGTLYLIEPTVEGSGAVDAHSMNPVAAIQMARALGGVKAKLYLIGCEPKVLESDNGEMGLSAEVNAALPQAIAMIESLVKGKENYEHNSGGNSDHRGGDRRDTDHRDPNNAAGASAVYANS
ncbi:MAG TPA: hydrogenase maturation protease [Verrucomicrobiae bacterium]|jgi:hydrogenase maturation protease|nr:hydrogenase maturation protease [Verrucomicrobiae bacterium]